jgi:hypothetical protein
MGQRARPHATGSRRVGIIGAVAALSLALPATSAAAITPSFLFNFPAKHGYTLLGSASGLGGRSAVSIQLEKVKLVGKDVYYQQAYAWSGFPATYTVNSKHTEATLSASLGTYGSVSLKFGDAKPEKVVKIKCPGSSKTTKVGKGEELGSATGSLTFDSQTSYFGTVTGSKSTKSELVPLGAFLATRQAADPLASPAASGNGILDCIPSLKGKLVYLTLPAQGATGLALSENTFFATHIGTDSLLSATDNTLSLTGGPDMERTISVELLGKSASTHLYSFASNLSSAAANAMGPFMSGSVSYHETTPCSNTKNVTFGDTTGGITAKFDEGGSVTYGGPGTVGEMDVIPSICDNPPSGAPG